MDMRTVARLTRPARATTPTRARAGLGADPAQAWRTAARAGLVVLISAALTVGPVVVWAVWLRGR